MDIGPILSKSLFVCFVTRTIFKPRKEESRHGRCDQTSEAAANEENRGETPRDVPLLGDPGEGRAELPRYEEAQGGGPEVEADHTRARHHAEEHGRGQAQRQRHQDHVPAGQECQDDRMMTSLTWV